MSTHLPLLIWNKTHRLLKSKLFKGVNAAYFLLTDFKGVIAALKKNYSVVLKIMLKCQVYGVIVAWFFIKRCLLLFLAFFNFMEVTATCKRSECCKFRGDCYNFGGDCFNWGSDCCFCQKNRSRIWLFFQKFKKGLFLRLFTSFFDFL